jgi:hypothetical protein
VANSAGRRGKRQWQTTDRRRGKRRRRCLARNLGRWWVGWSSNRWRRGNRERATRQPRSAVGGAATGDGRARAANGGERRVGVHGKRRFAPFRKRNECGVELRYYSNNSNGSEY